VKDKQRSKAAFIIDLDKKQAAEDLLNTLMSEKKLIILQVFSNFHLNRNVPGCSLEIQKKLEDEKIVRFSDETIGRDIH
jgi:hypothetical protein